MPGSLLRRKRNCIQRISNFFKRYFDGKRLEIIGDSDLESKLRSSELLINATPVGMNDADPSPVDASLLHHGLYIYDLVYNRPATKLVKEANSKKLYAVTGLGMLLYQGAIAFEIWTGLKAPIAVMRRALKETLSYKK